MSNFKRISQQVLYDLNFFTLVNNRSEEISTKEQFDRVAIEHIGAVAVVPVLNNGDILLIKQYRAAVDEDLVEVVAGRRDVEDEKPYKCALRELEEEAGVKAKKIEDLGWLYTTPGFTNERMYLYIATECEDPDLPNPMGIEEKFSEIIRCTFDQAITWINEGLIVDAKSVIAIERAYKFILNS